MKKISLITLIIILIIPQVTFASWWNPFSWKVFSWLSWSKYNSTIQIENNLEAVASSTDNVSTLTTKKQAENKSTLQPAVTPTITQTTVLPTSVNSVQPVVTPPPNTTLCNGTNWTVCPVGQNFICPPSGKAYCDYTKETRQALYEAEQAKCKAELDKEYKSSLQETADLLSGRSQHSFDYYFKEANTSKPESCYNAEKYSGLSPSIDTILEGQSTHSSSVQTDSSNIDFLSQSKDEQFKRDVCEHEGGSYINSRCYYSQVNI